MSAQTSSQFQQVLETVEALPPDDQLLLIQIIRQRLIRQRHAEVVAEVERARQEYRQGEVRRGSVADLLQELAE